MGGSPCVDGDAAAPHGRLKDLNRRREGAELLLGLHYGLLQFSVPDSPPLRP
jgi:hypothetical protein